MFSIQKTMYDENILCLLGVMHADITQSVMVICVLFHQIRFIYAASLSNSDKKRIRRGLLSRTGMCPVSTENYFIKDTRINYFGSAYQLPGEENTPCTENECIEDNECHGDRKCCKNHCGAYICTEAMRDPHPCEMFPCPAAKVCKIQRVKCVDPDCPDMLAISRPICVPGGPAYEIGKRSRIPRPNMLAYYQQQTQRSALPQEVVYNPVKPYYKVPKSNSFVTSYEAHKRTS